MGVHNADPASPILLQAEIPYRLSITRVTSILVQVDLYEVDLEYHEP